MEIKMKIKKKNGLFEDFDPTKIHNAVDKSATRVGKRLNTKDKDTLVSSVKTKIWDGISVKDLHLIVEECLVDIDSDVANSYKSYRDYKQYFASTMDEIYNKSKSLLYGVDTENANFLSTLISTKGSLIRGYLTKELYRKFILSTEELNASNTGYIYIHDLRDLMFGGINCCLFDMGNVLKGGFEMAGIGYSEPTSALSALQVIGDVTLAASAQQFGGFTIPEIDKVLIPYVQKSYNKHLETAYKYSINDSVGYALDKTMEELRQGFQSIELKLNTVPSSRGDFAFTTLSFGNCDTKDTTERFWQIKICETILTVRMGGQGKNHIPVVFPKLVYLYSKEQHENPAQQELFDLAVKCSSKAMYPDFLAIDTVGKVADIYRETGLVVSPMGCRAYLSDFKGDDGKSVFVGRANIGAVALNMPMIWMKSNGETFYQDLEYYLSMIREFLKKRYDSVANQYCSSNPLAFTQGGLYRGTKSGADKVGLDIVKSFTSSFGITALNELNVLMEGKRLDQSDRKLVNEVVDFIAKKVVEYKEEDGYLYALYAVPAESLAGTQREQFVKEYGVIDGVSDKPYFSNGFHVPVYSDISMFEKQDAEYELFHKINGGHIQYVRIEDKNNIEAIKQIVLRGMDMGFYQGVNFDLTTCEDCGHVTGKLHNECPVCNSKNLTTISRVCGYLGYMRQEGSTRFNDAKVSEVIDRKSM